MVAPGLVGSCGGAVGLGVTLGEIRSLCDGGKQPDISEPPRRRRLGRTMPLHQAVVTGLDGGGETAYLAQR